MNVTSLIRTGVPIAVGALLTWLAATLHIVISPGSEAALVALCTAALGAGYYFLVRLVESRFTWAGVLLGVPKAPTYPAPPSMPGAGELIAAGVPTVGP